MIKNILLKSTLLSLLSIGLAVASPKNTGTVPLGGGTIAPRGNLTFSFDDNKQLVPDIAYTISCNITDKNNPKNKIVMKTIIDYPSNASFYLNDKPIGSMTSFAQFQLPQVDNTFSSTPVFKYEHNFIFRNADQDDSVVVSNCQAIPVS